MLYLNLSHLDQRHSKRVKNTAALISPCTCLAYSNVYATKQCLMSQGNGFLYGMQLYNINPAPENVIKYDPLQQKKSRVQREAWWMLWAPIYSSAKTLSSYAIIKFMKQKMRYYFHRETGKILLFSVKVILSWVSWNAPR